MELFHDRLGVMEQQAALPSYPFQIRRDYAPDIAPKPPRFHPLIQAAPPGTEDDIGKQPVGQQFTRQHPRPGGSGHERIIS
jgi:hypothetical protein